MPRSVTYWEKWRGSELEAMAGLVRTFNASQDAFEVNLVAAGDWASSADVDAFLAAHRAGRPPDLIGLEAHDVADLASQGILAPLDAGLETRVRDLLRTDVADLGLWQRIRYALPIVCDLVTLYVNEAAARGTPLERGVPSSLPIFRAAIEEMVGQRPIPLVPTYPGWWPEAWPLFFGGGWFDEQGGFTPDRPENLEAYDWALALKDPFPCDRFPHVQNPLGSLSPDPFLSGEVVLILDGDWTVRRLVAEPGLAWTVAPVPTQDGLGGALLEADLVALPTGAQCPEGAAAFLESLLSSQPLEALALGQGKVSPLRDWSRHYVSSHPNPRLRELRSIWDRSRILTPPPVSAWRTTRGKIRDAFQAMWERGVRPEKVLAELAGPAGSARH